MRVSKERKRAAALWRLRLIKERKREEQDFRHVIDMECSRCERNAWKVRQFEARFRGLKVDE